MMFKNLPIDARLKDLSRQGISTEVQFRRTIGGTPSGPQALQRFWLARAWKISLVRILIDSKKSDGGGEREISPGLSKI